ncbi:MFS transporter [Chloroflexi bacterium TSY]|nr:MFS transporter [Chloroflexi bacterium TSY]
MNLTDSAPVQLNSQSLRPFFTIWTGQIASWMGSEVIQFALIWWLTSTTGSATVLAISTTFAILPRIVVGPFIGVFVDRWSRRMVMIVADAVVAAATICLAVLFWMEIAQIWHIYTLMAVRALGGLFHQTAMTASVSLLVPEEHLARIGGLYQTVAGIMAIVAPPLGALLVTILPMQSVLAIDVGTFALAIAPLLFIPIPQPAIETSDQEREGSTSFVGSVLDDLRIGLRFTWEWKALRILTVVIMIFNLLAFPMMTLVPILITVHFGGSASEFGWFQSALGIGAITGGFILSTWGGFRRRIVTMTLALVLIGVGNSVVGLTPENILIVAAMGWFFVGAMSSIFNGASLAILQATVPPEMQGRVFSINWSFVTAMAPIGLALAGPIADTFSASLWFLSAGLSQVAIGVWAFLIPALMQIEDQDSIANSHII